MRRYEFPFSHDRMFMKVMENEDVARIVAERCLGHRIGEIARIEVQKTIPDAPRYKSPRVDVYIEDVDGKRYNIEMQVNAELALGKRMRYYQSEIDRGSVAAGGSYGTDLMETFIVFICIKDPFGKGSARYLFERRCLEHPGIDLECGSHWMVLCADRWESAENPALSRLLEYVSTGEVPDGDGEIEMIDRSVGSLNAREDVIDMFRNIDLRNYELIEQGKAEGKAEGEALAYDLMETVSKELTRLGRSDEIPAVLAKGREGVEKAAEELGLAQPAR